MSLRVWLPLNGDLHNQGLSDVIVTNNGATVNTSGKIGKCYSIPSVTDLSYSGNNLNITSISLCCWVRFNTVDISDIINSQSYTSTYKASNGNILGNNSYGGFSLQWYTNNIYTNGSFSSINVQCYLRTSTVGTKATTSINLPLDTWNHLCAICDKTTNKCSLYLNGVFQNFFTFNTFNDATDRSFKLNYPATAGGNYRCPIIPILYNDVRIYDHALSALEVKEIARAKVLHYPLCENLGSGLNLIKNGFGELGTDNWTSKTMFSNDVPEDQPEIKQSVYGNSTLEYIPFWHNCTYRVSLWVKSTATSGYSYPSFIPYDIDKNQIQVRHTKCGFNMSTMTTLAQPLNPGDTKIYVTDLSKWNTASGHYYNYAAIFGYADSTGYIYPDGIYTRNIPAFGSGTSEKTNLDKTNNIINLINTYNGPAIPAGRSVCASCDGSTYFYPLGAIANTSIQDWTYKTTTFTSNNSYLVAARFLRFINIYNTTYCAGIKLVNESTIKTNNIIYDISGYCNNGTIIGDLEVSLDTPKYGVSTSFDGTTNCIQVPYNTICPDNIFTFNLWFKKDDLGSKSYETLFGGPSGFEMDSRQNNQSTLSLYMASTRSGKRNLVTELTFNTWYMVTMVRDGIKERYYINGIFQSEIDAKPMPTGIYRIGAWASNTGQNYYGNISDFRIYATALSAQDILSLYHNSALVDEQGIIHGAIH